MAHNIASDHIIEILIKVLDKAITQKQKRILLILHDDNFRFVTTTKAVKIMAVELACAESTVWDSISALKELGFVVCNGRIELTNIGDICVKLLEREKYV